MAETREGWGEEMDAKAHVSTYDSFITGAKWGTILIVGTLVLMAVFLL